MQWTDMRLLPILPRVVLFQIDGLSGTGKTTLSAELLRRGYDAVDSDAMFAHYADPVTGMPTESETRANWMWDGEKLKHFAAEPREHPVFVCGGAMNQDRFAHLFAKRFILCIDNATMRHRLLRRTNNSYGKAPEELAEQLRLNTRVMDEARRIGAIVIEASGPIEDVADEVIRLAFRPADPT